MAGDYWRFAGGYWTFAALPLPSIGTAMPPRLHLLQYLVSRLHQVLLLPCGVPPNARRHCFMFSFYESEVRRVLTTDAGVPDLEGGGGGGGWTPSVRVGRGLWAGLRAHTTGKRDALEGGQRPPPPPPGRPAYAQPLFP